MANIQKIQGKKGIAYRIRVSYGCNSEGNQIRKSFTWTPEAGMSEREIQRELSKEVIDFENRVRGGLVDRNIRFSEFSVKWIEEYVAKQLSPKYRHEAEKLLVDINKVIGHIPIQDLKKGDLQELYRILAEKPYTTFKRILNVNGKQQAKKVSRYRSPSTIRHYHRIISAILTKATQWDYLEHNICLGKRIELPKCEKHDPKCLQDHDIRTLVECLKNAPIQYKTLIKLILYTGMRNGEAMGLEWQDIDFSQNMISVRRVSQYLGGIGVFTKEPKNKTSVRTIPVVPEVMGMLRKYREWQVEQIKQVGELWKVNPDDPNEIFCDHWHQCVHKDDVKNVYCSDTHKCDDYRDADRLFTQKNGIPMHPDTGLRWLKRLIAKTDLPDIGIHSLRHTNVSIMLAKGVPLSTVAKLVGHSSPDTTMKIYAHSISTAESMAVKEVADVIDTGPVNGINQ